MTPEADFVSHWQDRLCGLALRGLVLDNDERTKGPHTAGAAALTLPDRVEKLLRAMFQDAQRLIDKPLPSNNGPPTTIVGAGVAPTSQRTK